MEVRSLVALMFFILSGIVQLIATIKVARFARKYGIYNVTYCYLFKVLSYKNKRKISVKILLLYLAGLLCIFVSLLLFFL